MKVWVVEVCDCEECGTMVLFGVYASEEAARADAEKAGLQNTDPGEDWDWRTDYYVISNWAVK